MKVTVTSWPFRVWAWSIESRSSGMGRGTAARVPARRASGSMIKTRGSQPRHGGSIPTEATQLLLDDDLLDAVYPLHPLNLDLVAPLDVGECNFDLAGRRLLHDSGLRIRPQTHVICRVDHRSLDPINSVRLRLHLDGKHTGQGEGESEKCYEVPHRFHGILR